ncbi:MAG: hypothetical protein ABSC05_18820 [Candidatus Solibacter sp.]|jgi:hypothetical protein
MATHQITGDVLELYALDRLSAHRERRAGCRGDVHSCGPGA